VQSSTLTDETGGYKLILEPGTYNITAYKNGYLPECTQITAQYNTEYIHDFIVNPTMTGTIAGEITGEFELPENEVQFVTVSFRQMANCNGGEAEIELISFIAGVGNDIYEYSVTVPPGDYTVVASSEGEDTLVFTGISVIEDEEVLLNIEFPL